MALNVTDTFERSGLIDAKLIENESMIHQIGCHCGAVELLVKSPADMIGWQCNCTICLKKGFIHLPVKRDQLKLLTDENNLSSYTFGTHTAKHLFCKRCGMCCFYIPRSDPNGYSVNINCIKSPVRSLVIKSFDGRNYDASVENYPPPSEALDLPDLPTYGVREL